MNYRTISEKNSTIMLPEWKDFSPEQSLIELKQLLKTGRELIANASQLTEPTFDQLVLPFEEFSDRLGKCWGPLSHLNNVMQVAYPTLRDIHDQGAQLLSTFISEMSLSDGLFQAYVKLKNSKQYPLLNNQQKKIIDDAITDFTIAGVALSQEKKARVMEINTRSTELESTFGNNVQKAQEEWSYLISDAALLEGIPEATVDALKRAAEEKGKTGYLVTLKQPIYLAIIEHAKDRSLRALVYEAYVTRASDVGPNKGMYDNTPVMKEIIRLRHEKAILLGYKNYNELSLAKKMAPDVATVDQFYDQLITKSRAVGKREFDELAAYAKTKLGIDHLEPWDIAYAAEDLQRTEYAVDHEVLRQYFPEEKVMSGLFSLVESLFGLSLKQRADVPVWRESVKYFDLYDTDGSLRGGVYADLYSEDGKRPGAWMDTCVDRRVTSGGVQLPVAYFNCNFTKPKKGLSAYLRHNEIETVFHEFGHVLHHIVGKVSYIDLSMGGVEWDAIEFPSQIMENWCWENDILKSISAHKETGGKISDEDIERLKKTKLFHVGMFLSRQLALGSYDWVLHRDYGGNSDFDIAKVWNQVWGEVSASPMPEWGRYAHTFLHVFDGSYAAGYYSYLWAEVLAADAYAAFEESGILSREVGLRYLSEILEIGSTRTMRESFRAFRGRDPDPQFLLKRYQIV